MNTQLLRKIDKTRIGNKELSDLGAEVGLTLDSVLWIIGKRN
jgi:hypothetical protein